MFDLDGTLADTAADITLAVNRVLAGAGLPPLGIEAVRPMIGDGSRKLIERAFTASGADAAVHDTAALLATFIAVYPSGAEAASRPYPGVRETIVKLEAAGIAMGVCTNKPQAPAERLIADLGLASFFRSVIGGDRLAFRKPDPRHLLAVLDGLGVPAAAAAMVGDGPQDIAAARAAGVMAIAFASHFGVASVETLGADATIRHFAEIPALLASGTAGLS